MSRQRIKDWATGKSVLDTPEEAVRQEYEKILHYDYGYAKEQIDIEVIIERGSARREKADIVVYKTTDKHKRNQGQDILFIVETKRPTRKDGIKQLISYATATCAMWAVWTNGSEIEYLYKNPETGEVVPDYIYQMPRNGETLRDIGRLSKDKLRSPSNLKLIFRRLLNTLYANTNISRREKLGNEMVKLLFCKMRDEQYNPNSPTTFFLGLSEDRERMRGRIVKLFDGVKKDMVPEGIFTEAEEILLDTKSLAYVVGELQMYTLLQTDQDVVGDAFEVFAESKFIGEKGEFFTPRQVVSLAVDAVVPSHNDTIIDPACGSGGFLIYALQSIWDNMENDHKYKGMPPGRLADEKKRIAQRSIHGIDKEIDLVKIAKAYMCIIGDGKSRIANQNSLHIASEFEGQARALFVERNGKTFKQFDIVLANPPFGSKEAKVLEEDSKHFDLGHTWKRGEDKTYYMTDSVKKTPAQELFIERCFNMLKDGGRMAIVLPETIFHAPSKKHIIQYIESHGTIECVFDLPHNAFRPHCNAKTCLMVFRKDKDASNDIVFAVLEEIGTNHLGKTMYRIKNQKLTDEIWDDTEKVKSELSDPANERNQYTFTIPRDKIKNGIYVPRYYWGKNDKILPAEAKKLGCDLVSFASLVESGVVQDFKGHGSPPSEYKGFGDVPYVRAGDVGNWAIYKNPTAMIPEHVYYSVKKENSVDLQSNDIIFVKEGSYRVGDVAMLLPSDTNILLNSHCLVFRATKELNEYDIDPYYLLYLLSHDIVKLQLPYKILIDTTLPNIGDRWKELLLPISRDKAERDRIKEKVRKSFKKREQAEQGIAEIMRE